ncbi:type I-F CRISPR-associated protein Csy2 [Gynuella sp.]|uniref:type I-F CRISPR-associated protein Csy2 n=1 Tax=Gynuella sp. TaxID=2969146 RepID=UPI003D147AAF
MNEKFLLMPHLQVQNANALSSPFTIGFPAMTAWLGAVHAMERKLIENNPVLRFNGVGVVSHQFDLQTYRGPGDYEYSIIGTANPLDKTGARSAFIEEPRCHLEVSLVIAYDGIEKQDETTFLDQVHHLLISQLKIAGGDILRTQAPKVFRDFDLLKNRLMPGYALIERRDLMINAMEQGRDAFDALLDFLSVHHQSEQIQDNNETTISWRSQRKTTGEDGKRGWIVPIATGFHAISELAEAKNQRDPATPHRFVESLVTLGEFVMAHKMDSSEQLLWHYHHDITKNLYLCQQQRTDPQTLLSEDGF